MEIAVKNNVTILLLPPYSSYLLQPIDLAVLGLVKSTWDQRLCNRSRHHQGQKLSKADLSKLIGEIWEDNGYTDYKKWFQKSWYSSIQ